MIWRTALLCLLIFSLGRAFFHLPTNYNYDFSSCVGATCRSGQSVAYGCINGNCTYVCSDGFCSGYRGYQGVLPPMTHRNLLRPWGYGVVRHQDGCHGGNCGYWGGCMNDYCGGYYDFRGCQEMDCRSGPFHGYGCSDGNCGIICNGRNCYIENTYGTPMGTKPNVARNKTFENEPRAPSVNKPYDIRQYRRGLEDLGETFKSKDKWMLRTLNRTEIFDLVKSWIKDEKVFNEMKPDGKEVKFILNEFRKRNRMQTRLELWREGKKSQMYYSTLCPYKQDQCSYSNQFPLMIPYQPCPQMLNRQYTPRPIMPYQSPFYPPQSYFNPRPWAPTQYWPPNPYVAQPQPRSPPPVYRPPPGWAPPQVPVNCPGGCPHPKLPVLPPPSVNPQAPRAPPSARRHTPGWGPPKAPYVPQSHYQRPPMIPQPPVYPHPHVVPQSPYQRPSMIPQPPVYPHPPVVPQSPYQRPPMIPQPPVYPHPPVVPQSPYQRPRQYWFPPHRVPPPMQRPPMIPRHGGNPRPRGYYTGPKVSN
ncbi:unnamed protein product [Rodentolepis nana]|uniref:Basic proline-rich protein-like n=1 Tax=Rodentolepis nana TaxID=102285 RepID=A0A0R3TSC9_RODNA|nr:unnamed protein product [Rodentolepis nana]